MKIEALKFYKDNIIVVDYPTSNPYLNPIENVWINLKLKLSGRRFILIKQLEAELIKI